MSIEPIKGRGGNRATAQCDGCGRNEVVTCDYERCGRGGEWLPNEGQVKRKLTSMGWAVVKGKHLCMGCEAKRKAEASVNKEPVMAEKKTNVAQIRQPTKAQEVDIINTLSMSYDRGRQCYLGKETDRTVADAAGAGIMPGWVAKIREEYFGPAGNEEVGLIRQELAKCKADHDTMIEGLRRDLDMRIASLTKRLDACVDSHDRRVS